MATVFASVPVELNDCVLTVYCNLGLLEFWKSGPDVLIFGEVWRPWAMEEVEAEDGSIFLEVQLELVDVEAEDEAENNLN